MDVADDEQSGDERVICHLVGRTEWSVGAAGYRPASLGTEGFIHFSTPAQIAGTANRFYSGRDDLLLVVVDPERLTAPLRWEPPAVVEPAVPAPGLPAPVTGELFPHLYGPIDAGAVAAVIPFPPGADGSFSVPSTLW
ncbi:DUF952 domain-containing protein [Frankia tisae]|uniref:DUF952 domain-containing protein n=1 Tax=Frankia tisae TaxID=2950104 RepID=UPI0021C1DDA4|nr:DUF952 domain-containing protein [Frankia tisae]